MVERSSEWSNRQRLLEGWLPLAQEANQEYGWGYGPADLEALILDLAGDLGRVDSAAAARAVLWSGHIRRRSFDA